MGGNKMDIYTLKVLLEQVDIKIEEYRINSVSGMDRIFISGMMHVRQLINEDIESLRREQYTRFIKENNSDGE